MLLNTWSLALSLGSLLVVFLLAVAAVSAVRVLRYWNPASDDARQIGLESEIWLSSTLVAYALGIQIISLVLLVLAADEFAGVITGAMCATGTLLANDFGIPALLLKMTGVFFYGFWLVLHRLDTRSEFYPLVRLKCWYLLAIIPLVGADIVLQTLYLLNLQPDIIVSCCAVVFSAASSGSQFMAEMAGNRLVPYFYGTMILLALLGGLVAWRHRKFAPAAEAAAAEPDRADRLLLAGYGLAWAFFLPLALLTIITVISSYIYAMPFHNCPFCILKPEYAYVGFAIYGTLLPAAFLAISAPVVDLLRPRFRLNGVATRPAAGEEVVTAYQRFALLISLLLLVLFAFFSSFHLWRYFIMGGEV